MSMAAGSGLSGEDLPTALGQNNLSFILKRLTVEARTPIGSYFHDADIGACFKGIRVRGKAETILQVDTDIDLNSLGDSDPGTGAQIRRGNRAATNVGSRYIGDTRGRHVSNQAMTIPLGNLYRVAGICRALPKNHREEAKNVGTDRRAHAPTLRAPA